MSHEPEWSETGTASEEGFLSLDEVLVLLLEQMQDGLDHPELWADIPAFATHFPNMRQELTEHLAHAYPAQQGFLAILLAMVVAADDPHEALRMLEPLAVNNSLSALVQGALFHVQGLVAPDPAKFDLSDRLCVTPFQVLDVLENSTHLCCASWLQRSAGNLNDAPWQEVWNSETAQEIRASIHDGSYKFCNKTACPHITAGALPKKADLVAKSDFWRDVIENERTEIEAPFRVNLAYDRTCNLSCPSCRTSKWAADAEIRARFDKLQEEKILPMLKQSKIVFITGSGDPFASKNFRNLLERLGPEDYPDLRFQVMTNGMLFTPREWERFPALHGRVASLRISLDAATGPTHELLRRGARWEVMLENLAFAAELRRQGLVDSLDFAYTVQVENYRELGDAVDFAKAHNADAAAFLRLTNWGTFSAREYADRAVFMTSHPEHAAFIEMMQDPRLQDPIVRLADLATFVREPVQKAA